MVDHLYSACYSVADLPFPSWITSISKYCHRFEHTYAGCYMLVSLLTVVLLLSLLKQVEFVSQRICLDPLLHTPKEAVRIDHHKSSTSLRVTVSSSLHLYFKHRRVSQILSERFGSGNLLFGGCCCASCT